MAEVGCGLWAVRMMNEMLNWTEDEIPFCRRTVQPFYLRGNPST